ncbi:hypothetical protein [Streptomyces sp. CB02261]|uniref:hypothetical protein n=1 Tax=Streptomyces sp. CB02261 TaxID=1703940 RepID=UPI00093D94AD|nr:hypothetical protein [Streptomyces sp. CB02261]OKJ64174.1 hypothetical protein AMK29_19120 [Streptomyces sp. CB02261]
MARTLALVLTSVTAIAVTPAVAGSEPGRAAADKAVTYRVTAPYQQHANGVRAGYKPDQYCVFDRAGGTGALGYPHFNHAHDNSTDPARPTALLYEDDGKGGKRLVGVEWLVYDRDQNLKTDDDRPSMFGVPFKGPNRGNYPGQPVHYALHLWLWKKNPEGQFATYNPAVTCLPGTTRPQPRPSS